MKKRQPTYSRQDILEEVEITPKQLRTWTERNLFTPELGSKPGRGTRFTEGDLRAVSVIRKLVVEEKYGIDTVKSMLTSKNPAEIDFRLDFWDYASGRWLHADEVARRYISTARPRLAPGRPSRLHLGSVAA